MKNETFICLTKYRSLVKKAVLPVMIGISSVSCKDFDNLEVTSKENAASRSAVAGQVSSGSDFTIVVLSDTQYYVEGTPATPKINMNMYLDQIQWIIDNKTTENIAYVAHVGDMTDNGDNSSVQWPNNAKALYKLDTAGIAYGPCVGNHDQYPNGSNAGGGPLTSTTNQFNQYFGVAHFTGKPWYGGNYGTNNDTHYDLFSAGGIDFIAISIEYDLNNQQWNAVNTWAYNLLTTYPSRKAIVTTHFVTGGHSQYDYNNDFHPFSAQAQAIYDRLKSLPNLFLFLGGHVNGEGYRQDTYNGKTVKTMVSDYQFYKDPDGVSNGGNGYMRLIKISPENDKVTVKTYSPYLENRSISPFFLTDANSQFELPLFHDERASRTCDINQDGKTELTLYSGGTWKVAGMSNATWGVSSDIPVPADYNGDGKAEITSFRPSTGQWIARSATGSVLFDHAWGSISGDTPVPGDYDADGRADIAVYRPSTGAWIGRAYSGGTLFNIIWGISTDIPVPGDYDGDGRIDIVVYRRSAGAWIARDPSDGSVLFNRTWGVSTDIPVPGDYNGDGKTDILVFRPSTREWIARNPANGSVLFNIAWGNSGDIPAPGDYDGDGTTDVAVYRPSTNQLLINGGGTVTLGASGDKLVNLPYHIRKFFFP
ncbi:FG-GAP-like repeat-containing protein [Pedobacter heparinus]|uniref:Metallophosphoesterase n=1 Tax=Pedobacter heparinus (strain ATCC 13125 / DSM 2366 / CIP 104194 / JCM 7457 / NBRC 12017 / NCIMB 9290 / NRRL B-14731 / HIM 762-3) TaxID=485917 RepID=C6Y0D1_PEDHD|nr:FG-GAP-like repeat-containing protein [Pedobacter heparinus]ACU04843.1 metallophosphoesterase [Pedobacter heparinus DSM 2366]